MNLSTQLFTIMFCSLLWGVSSGSSPKTAYFSAYATVEENTLYIQGGTNISTSDDVYTQFYSLDLTQSWDTSNPPWSEVTTIGLIPAGLEAWAHSISLSRNQKTLTFWNINGSISYAASFHLDTSSWEELPALPLMKQKLDVKLACRAATDPRTNEVYIPGGIDMAMLSYSPTSKSSIKLPMERSATNTTFWSGYSFVWSDVRMSFLYFGGYDYPGFGSPYFYEFRPERLNPWSTLSSSGSVPPPLANSCMVPAYNGTKILVFGGVDALALAYIDILYILDVPTMTWSQGAKYQPRLGMVCSVSGDYLIVWGGISVQLDDTRKITPLNETLILYNIKKAQWTTQFIDKKTSSNNSNKNAAIIGGSVGAVVVTILIAGMATFRTRCRHRQQQKQEIQVSSPLQLRPEQDIEEELMENTYFRDIQPRPEGAITPHPTFQRTQPAKTPPVNTSHSHSPQYDYAQGPQQDSVDPPPWRTSISPSQRIRSMSSSRSTSALVATPTMPTSPRYPSYQQQHRSPQQQQQHQSVTLSPPTRRTTRNPQGRNTPEPTSNSNHNVQYQIDALHAEASRLQAMLDS